MDKCILCAENCLKPIEAAQPGRYYHCRVCDLIFLDPSMRLSRNKEKNRYLEHNNTIENAGYVAMFEDFLRTAVLPFVKAGAQALDFGCGPGPVLQELLKRHGFHAQVYDPYFAPSMPQRTFDLITATEVLEHVYGPAKVWEGLAALLKRDAVLAIMTHFHPGQDAFAAWWYRRDPTHVVFYSEATFRWLCGAYGFRLLFSDSKKTVALQKAIV